LHFPTLSFQDQFTRAISDRVFVTVGELAYSLHRTANHCGRASRKCVCFDAKIDSEIARVNAASLFPLFCSPVFVGEGPIKIWHKGISCQISLFFKRRLIANQIKPFVIIIRSRVVIQGNFDQSYDCKVSEKELTSLSSLFIKHEINN